MHATRRSTLFLLVPSTLAAAVGCADVPMASDAADGPQIYQPNSAPSALILSPESGDTLAAGQTWQLVGRVADADSAAQDLRASWSYDGAEVCSDITPSADGIVTCEASGAAGKGDLTLSVVDSDGLESATSISITVEAGEGPSVHVDSAAGQNIYSDHPITFTGVASGEGNLSVTIRSHQDGEFEVDLNDDGSFSATTTLTPGDHVITVTVTDDSGLTDNHGTTVYVEGPNTAPNCALLTPAAGDLTKVGRITTMTASADDADVGAAGLQVAWKSSIDGYLGEGAFDTNTGLGELSASLSEGTHTLEFTATDEVGATCTDTIRHVVGSAPEIAISSSDAIIDEGVKSNITAVVSDAATMTGRSVVRWTVDGVLAGTTTTDVNGVTLFDTSAMTMGLHTVVATVRDLNGWESAAMTQVVVNGRPSAPVVRGGGSVTSFQDLTVELDSPGVDPEGETVTHSYNWYVNGARVKGSTNTFSADNTSRGDLVSVEVAAHDGRIAGDSARVDFTIVNAHPESTGVSITPAAPTSADAVTCAGTATDSDGDRIHATYTWMADGSLVGIGPVLAAGTVPGGQKLVCTVNFSDGIGGSKASTVPVVMGRSAPVMRNVGFRQAAPTVETGLDLAVSAYDPDGDEFSYDYAWTINGAPAGDGPVIGSAVAAGDLVSVSVTARDSSHTSAPAVASVVIANADIYAPEVSITPDEPAAGDDLVCAIDVEAFDPDGSALTHVVSWTRDGKLWEGDTFDTDVAGDSIDGEETEDGEVWACSVHAEGGDRSSEVAVASAEIGAARESTYVDVMAADLLGAGDTCGNGEAVMDGTLIDLEHGTDFVATTIAVEKGRAPHAVTFDLDVAVCNADSASDVNFSWGVFVDGQSEAIASGTETLAADGGCTCPDGNSTPLTIGAVLDQEGKMEQMEVRLMTDADEMALIPALSGSYIDVTYSW